MITECARMVLSEKELQINTLRFDLDIVDNYQNEVFERQLQEEQKYKDFVSDRSFDFLAYTAEHARILSNLINSPRLQAYILTLKAPDCFIFHVKPCKATLVADGVRENLTWDGITAIDAMVKLLIQLFGLRCFQINTDSMQERVQLVDAVLSCHIDVYKGM